MKLQIAYIYSGDGGPMWLNRLCALVTTWVLTLSAYWLGNFGKRCSSFLVVFLFCILGCPILLLCDCPFCFPSPRPFMLCSITYVP